MATFLYRCPNTGFRVQGYSAEQTSSDQDIFEPVTCLICKAVHLVNLTSGEVLSIPQAE